MKNNIVMKRKMVIVLFAMVLIMGLVVNQTLAWLTDKTEDVVNTFTYGDINITLTETTGATYKILPGNDIVKDPKVTVKAGSEPSWLFVKIVEVNWPVTDPLRKVNYTVVSTGGWSQLKDASNNDVPGVYYREVDAVSDDTDFAVLLNNKITVSNTLTKAEVNAAIALQPKLTFTAYAVQRDGTNLTTPAAAWDVVAP